MQVLRYLSRQLMGVCLVVTLLLTVAIWLTQSLRFVSIILTHGVQLTDFLTLMVWLLPDLLMLATPAAFLVAVLIVYNRFIGDHECVALTSAGCSPFFLMRPIVWVGGIVTLCVYGITFYVLPLSLQVFREKQVHLRSHYSKSMIREGEFNTLGKIMVYTDQSDGQGGCRGLFVYDGRVPGRPRVVTAQEALVTNTPEGGVKIMLSQGAQQTFQAPDRRPSLLEYQDYVLQVQPELGVHTPKVYEMFASELWGHVRADNTSQAAKSLKDLTQRFLMPLYVLSFGLLGGLCMLRGVDGRARRQKAIGLALGACFVVEVLSLIVLNAQGLGLWAPSILASVIVLTPCVVMMLWARKSGKAQTKVQTSAQTSASSQGDPQGHLSWDAAPKHGDLAS